MTDPQAEWDQHRKQAEAFCDDIYERWLTENGFSIPIAPVPTHVELMKKGWEALRPQWADAALHGKCILSHPMGAIPDILYEEVRYGDEWVIEAEGVIVERLPIR